MTGRGSFSQSGEDLNEGKMAFVVGEWVNCRQQMRRADIPNVNKTFTQCNNKVIQLNAVQRRRNVSCRGMRAQGAWHSNQCGDWCKHRHNISLQIESEVIADASEEFTVYSPSEVGKVRYCKSGECQNVTSPRKSDDRRTKRRK